METISLGKLSPKPSIWECTSKAERNACTRLTLIPETGIALKVPLVYKDIYAFGETKGAAARIKFTLQDQERKILSTPGDSGKKIL